MSVTDLCKSVCGSAIEPGSSFCISLILMRICVLLQNMYDEGDDEMKKTIAKAWTEARTGQNANKPDFGSSLKDTF